MQDYIPVEQEELRDYVKARLKVFYEEELDVPLVLFNEVLDHVLRIDRWANTSVFLIWLQLWTKTMKSTLKTDFLV